MDELQKILDSIPEKIRVKDGDEIVICRLCMFYFKLHKAWTVGYYSTEMDYFYCCGYGETIIKAVKHLKRTIKGIRIRTDRQYDVVI